MTAPFMAIADFANEYQGTLTTGETATATRLLQVASDRIRGLKADVDEEAAKQVVFEIVRDAANYGDVERLSEFDNTTSRHTESGKLDPATRVVNDYLSDRHKRILGIALVADPVYNFPEYDY